MSFRNANQAFQQFIINSRYAFPKYESINAVLDARRLNTTILEGPAQMEGKLRQIKISHYPADCNIVADDCDNNLCTAGTEMQPAQEWFTLSECLASKPRTLSIDSVRDVDGNYSFSDHAMAQMRAGFGNLRKQLAIDIDTKILAHKGLHLDGNSYKRITMSNTTNGLMTPLGLWEIQKEFSDGGYINPFIVGSTEVFNWKKSLGIAGQNTTLGQDFAKLNDTNMYYDTVLNTVQGDTTLGEYVIAFDPEALKFVSFNENLGIFATALETPAQMDIMYKSGGTDYMYGVVRDPENGLLWDFYMNFEKCAGVNNRGAFTWQFKLKWDIFFPKVESCNIQGVNGIFVYKTCPVVIPVCPTGDTPSPAAVARNFNWVPGLSYPFTLSDITIGGITTHPNSAITSLADLAAALNEAYGVSGVFVVAGAAIRYSGYSAITGTANNAEITITFA